MTPCVVIAGVDGSASALEAVEAAAKEAAWRGCALAVIHALETAAADVPLGPGVSELRHRADAIVAAAVERARQTAPQLTITTATIPGPPAAVLTDEAQTAELVVVGSRGLGGFSGLLLGSTGVQLAAHASCPVLVVRNRGDRADGVLLAVDGSKAGSAAVGFAFEEASLRGTHLTALHAWDPWNDPFVRPPDTPPLLPQALEDSRETETVVLAEALAGWQSRYPDVSVHRRLVRGPVRPTLIDASGEAALLVVGARGKGGFTGLLLGSVSHAMLHHAHCPVAVVRGRA